MKQGETMRKILFLTLYFTYTLHATIYQSTDKNGTAIFSNSPSYNSKPMQLEKLQTYSVAADKKIAPEKKNIREKQPAYQRLEFANLKNNATIRNNNSSPFMLQLTIKPGLRKSDRAVLMLDGKPMGKEVVGPREQLNFKLFNVNRGSHQLQVKVFSVKEKQQLFKSELITVNFQQNSIKFKKSD